MSEIIKLGYRSLGGFIAVIFCFAFGVSAITLYFVGAGILALAIFIQLDSSLLETLNVQALGAPITDPTMAAIILIIGAIIVFVVASVFVGLIFLIIKSVGRIDQELSKVVDRNITPIQGLRADKISQLERITKLREKGTLSDSEFEKEKAKIMQQYDS